MSTSKSQINFILDQLKFVPEIRTRKMFGEYGLYAENKFFGMVCEEKLFLKSTESLRLLIKDDGQRAYPGASDGYYHIDYEYIENPKALKKIVLASLDFVPKPKLIKQESILTNSPA